MPLRNRKIIKLGLLLLVALCITVPLVFTRSRVFHELYLGVILIIGVYVVLECLLSHILKFGSTTLLRRLTLTVATILYILFCFR